MCESCAAEYGPPPEGFIPNPELVVDLRRLYVHCPTGGPLHVVTDDSNLEDGFIRWCIGHAAEYTCDPAYSGVSNQECARQAVHIGERLLGLSVSERYETIREALGG